MRGLWVSSALLVAATALVPAAAVASGAPEPGAEPLVVQFARSATRGERAAELASEGLTVVDEVPGSDFVLAVPARGAEVDSGGAIEDVAPLVTYRAMGVPNDPGYEFQWHLPAIDAASAWDVTTGLGTTVAIIDSGAAYEDFGAFLRAPDLAATRFVAGWDFVDGDSHPNDENGHGTHVTSTVAAATNNGFGVAGVAPGVAIMPLRALDAAGAGSDWTAAQALRFAADHGADVANLSFGSPTPSNVMTDAVGYARSQGVTIVAASGNEGGAISYPAAIGGVIAVGAVRLDRTRASYSNFGPTLDLVAPGGDTEVDQNADDYPDGILQETFEPGLPSSFGFFFIDGTSMAAPQVSAVAALVTSLGVGGPDAVEAALRSTALDLGAVGRDDQFGYGLVQSGAAVRAVGLPAGPPVRGINNACPSGSTPQSPFVDLAGSVHAAAVSCVASWGVAGGKTPTTFDPNGLMTRAQLATFVARELQVAGASLPSSPPDAFFDDESSVHELRINQLAAIGVVQGRGGSSYAPGAAVTRAEMATFLVRAHDFIAASPLPGGADAFFDDEASVHEGSINKVAAAGLAAGVSPGRFAPSSAVRRGQMATFLARLLDLFVEVGATSR